MPIGRGRIPHDLAHMATENHFGITDGFWGLLARGATFDHGTDQRRTTRGRQLIRDHRDGLRAAEALGNEHHFRWLMGQPTPVADTFERLARRWEDLADGGTLTVRWPTLELLDDPATGTEEAGRAGTVARHGRRAGRAARRASAATVAERAPRS
jgi:hypothetical protein